MKLSQDEFALLTGLHPSSIGFLERGKRNLTLDTLTRIAGALNVSLATLFAEAGL